LTSKSGFATKEEREASAKRIEIPLKMFAKGVLYIPCRI
jgi:hypothetical protein